MHGTPDTLQSDRGKEFYGAVKRFSENKRIKMTKSSAYHPQSQGKVERSHRTLRKKINYDLVKQGRKGVNWVKNLQEYAKCLNNDKREELGWRSAFEVYYGRKSNELVKCGVPINREIDTLVEPVTRPSQKRVQERQQCIDEQRQKVKVANKKICDRVVEYSRRRNKCSQYSKGEKVFIRYGEKQKGKIAPEQRYVILGEVINTFIL